MRVPNWLTKTNSLIAIALLASVAGSVTDHTWLHRWGIVFAIFAMGSLVVTTIQRATRDVLDYIHRWAHQPFESGFRAGLSCRRSDADDAFTVDADPRKHRQN